MKTLMLCRWSWKQKGGDSHGSSLFNLKSYFYIHDWSIIQRSMCMPLCTLLWLFIQLRLTLQVWVWQKFIVKCQRFYEHMHTSLEMNKWSWFISLLIWKIVTSGQRKGPCLSKFYKGQHSPSLFLVIITINNRYKSKKSYCPS